MKRLLVWTATMMLVASPTFAAGIPGPRMPGDFRLLFAVYTATTADASTPAPTSSSNFRHLSIQGGKITTLNGVPLQISAARGFKIVGPEHRRDVFSHHPYEISMAAYVSGTTAVIVQAERVADGSGASDYDNLPAVRWQGEEFRFREMCATTSRADVEGEHDLRFLRNGGFDPVGGLALRQYFSTTADHNAEVVISLAVKTSSCSDAAGIVTSFAHLSQQVHIRVMGPA